MPKLTQLRPWGGPGRRSSFAPGAPLPIFDEFDSTVAAPVIGAWVADPAVKRNIVEAAGVSRRTVEDA